MSFNGRPIPEEAKRVAILAIFVAIGILADQIPFSSLVGGMGQTLTFFDIFSPMAVLTLGLWDGGIAILIAKLLSVVVAGKALDAMVLLRLLPPLAAGAFFWVYGQKERSGWPARLIGIGIPALMMLAFMLHPAIFGTIAMLYSLWWLIPIAAALRPNHPVLRAYGTTFTQHAVGSVIFLYTIPALQNPAVWLALIPVVAFERGILGGGIFLMAAGVEALLARLTLLRKSMATHQDADGAPMPQKKRKK